MRVALVEINMIDKLLLRIMVWAGSKLFQYVDVFAPSDSVTGIVFANSEEYMEYVMEYEDA